MPDCYQNPGYELAPGMTAMLAVTGPETAFPGGERGLPISALVGSTFQTILFVEVDADQAVVWTSPDDWQFDPDDPFRGLGGARPGGKFLAATADTAVFKYDVDLPEESIVPMFTRADDAVMPMPKF